MKTEIVDQFYSDHYKRIMGTGAISKAWAHIHKQMERPFRGRRFNKILEIGAGNGEHIGFVQGDFDSYYATDLRIDNLIHISKSDSRIKIEVQNAECLTYETGVFNRIIVTCLLVHLDSPEKALMELNRVLDKKDGHISIYLPCEPGVILRFFRKFTTHRKAKSLGVHNIALLHFLEHRNYFIAMDFLIRNEFSGFNIKSRFFPFYIFGWNFNLYKIYQISTS
jgi:ubiquinone/menaquinone biosynthesis C-methylase UbiE